MLLAIYGYTETHAVTADRKGTSSTSLSRIGTKRTARPHQTKIMQQMENIRVCHHRRVLGSSLELSTTADEKERYIAFRRGLLATAPLQKDSAINFVHDSI